MIDYANQPIGTNPVFYHAYQQGNTIMSGQIPVVHARLNTLRIMKEDQTMLTIKHNPSGQNILHIPITQYLLLSKDYTHIGVMGEQEYLDRQDSYTFIFFVKSLETVPIISSEMSVNGWFVRMNNAELKN